ncbi:H-NS family nucleoid-associated regulatory protein [Azoarcus sp. DD4]|uniref:H-NS histone family protein n=1 Tax=Azoarcus sp. DD4 TaxID=2027405 RepID=UPI001F0EC54D|nr:H-NS histone family protein [Azoarcus sp. DD4]
MKEIIEIDLKRYTLPQLRELGSRIGKAIDRQESAARAAVIRRIAALARSHGVSLDELAADAVAMKAGEPAARRAPAAMPREPLPAKYRHPNNRELGWSGRGRQPHWVTAWLANGGSLDALAIAAEKLAPRRPPVM